MSLLSKIKEFFKGKTYQTMPLDIEAIRRDEQLKALVQRNTALESQIGDLKVAEHQISEEEKSKIKERDFIAKLRQDQSETHRKNVEKSFSFMLMANANFTSDLKYKRGRKPIEITDKNDEEIIGIFGDFGLINGEMVIRDIEGNVIVRGESINQIIYKPETLPNQVKRGRIAIPFVLDDSGQLSYLPDFENLEIRDVTRNNKNEYEDTTEITDKAKNIVITKNKRISQLRRKIEVLEKTVNGLKDELDDKTSALNISQNQINENKSKMAEVMNLNFQYTNKLHDAEHQNVRLMELKSVLESKENMMRDTFDELLKKVQGRGSQTTIESARVEMLDLMEQLKNLLPQTVNQIMPAETKVDKPIMPGQSLGHQMTEVK